MSKLMIALTALLLVAVSHDDATAQQFRDARFGTPFKVYGGHGTNEDVYEYRPTSRADRTRRRQIERAERSERTTKRRDAVRSNARTPNASREQVEAAQATDVKPQTQTTAKSVTTGTTAQPAAAETSQNTTQKTCKQYFAQIGMTVSVPCTE